MKTIKDRTLLRAINGHYPDAPFVMTKGQITDKEEQYWLFVNANNHLLAVIDKGTHLELHDNANPNDSPEKPTLKLSKGKKIKPII